MFGKCKVCAEKDKRIETLINEVSFLRGLVHPPVNNSSIPESDQEANNILDVLDRPAQVQTHAAANSELSEAELAERIALLSGDY